MMTEAKRIGRVTGVFLLVQMATGLIVPFVLLAPVNEVMRGTLGAAAANAGQIRAAVLIAFLGAALTVTIGVTVWPIFRRHSERLALALLVACAISCALDAVQNASVMAVLTFSQDFANLGTADAALYRPLGATVTAIRKWAHYSQLFAIAGWMFLFYCSLWRFRLVPRVLAGLGLLGVTLQFTGVTLWQYFGLGSLGVLAMPLGPIHLIVGVWLIAKGFKEHASHSGKSDIKI